MQMEDFSDGDPSGYVTLEAYAISALPDSNNSHNNDKGAQRRSNTKTTIAVPIGLPLEKTVRASREAGAGF
jgi:hypothetical protein